MAQCAGEEWFDTLERGARTTQDRYRGRGAEPGCDSLRRRLVLRLERSGGVKNSPPSRGPARQKSTTDSRGRRNFSCGDGTYAVELRSSLLSPAENVQRKVGVPSRCDWSGRSVFWNRANAQHLRHDSVRPGKTPRCFVCRNAENPSRRETDAVIRSARNGGYIFLSGQPLESGKVRRHESSRRDRSAWRVVSEVFSGDFAQWNNRG